MKIFAKNVIYAVFAVKYTVFRANLSHFACFIDTLHKMTLQETVTDQNGTPDAIYIDIPDDEWDDFAAQFSMKVYHSKSAYRNQSLLITALVALLGGAVTYFVSGRALKPLREFSETVEKVQAQNLTDCTIGENKITELDRNRQRKRNRRRRSISTMPTCYGTTSP